MSNIRLFFSNTISANMTDRLDKSQSHYLTKVMRVKENEVFSIFNKNGEWQAKVLGIIKGIVEFKTVKQLRKKESSKELYLAFSPIKSNYQNFMIQKATELGVTRFLPIIFERTVVRKINNERLIKIVIEASEHKFKGKNMSEKKDVSFEIYSDSEKMLDQITDKYDLPDKSKALRCLLDYVEEKESDWDDMFATVRCNRCG